MSRTLMYTLAFAVPALIAAALGALVGSADYGAFEMGFLYNYVLGPGIGAGLAGLAATAAMRSLRRPH